MLKAALRGPFEQALRRPFGSASVSLGPELLVNGDFANGATGWSVNNADATHIATFSGGTLRYQSGTTSPQLNVQQANILTVGKYYVVTIEIAAFVSGLIKTDVSVPGTVFGSAVGSYTYRILSASTNFNITRSTANVDITVDRVSVRQVL